MRYSIVTEITCMSGNLDVADNIFTRGLKLCAAEDTLDAITSILGECIKKVSALAVNL